MSIIGIDIDRNNPSYTIDDYCFWIPKMEKFMQTDEGKKYFNKLYPMMNNKVFYSIFGTDWEYAISLSIAHYLTLIGSQKSRPVGSSLEEAAGGGASVTGVLTGMSVGGFSKSYDYSLTIKSQEDEALFWNQTQYGVQFYALLKQKAQPSIFVVTNGNAYDNRIDEDESNNEGWM